MMLDHLPDAKMVAAASWHVFTHRTFSRRLREDFEDFARSNAVVLLLVVDLVDHAEQPAVAAIQRVFQRFPSNNLHAPTEYEVITERSWRGFSARIPFNS